MGTDADIAEFEELRASLDMPTESSNTQQAVEMLGQFFTNTPEKFETLRSLSKHLLNKVMELLNHPEPLHDDFTVLLENIEKNSLLMQRLMKQAKSPNADTFRELEEAKETLPADCSAIMPHLLKLALNQTEFNLETLGNPLDPEEEKFLRKRMDKKKFAAPIRSLRPLQPFYRGPQTDDFVELILLLKTLYEALAKGKVDELQSQFDNLVKLEPDAVNTLCKDYARQILGLTQAEAPETQSVLSQRRGAGLITVMTWRDIFRS